MKHTRLSIAVVAAAACSACSSIQGPPQVGANVAFASAYVFRGVPQVDAFVLQPDVSVALPTSRNGTASLLAWGNVDLESDSGDAVLPGGNSGSFTEIDIVPEYAWTSGDLAFAAGFIDYNFPAGGKSTREAYFSVSGGLLGMAATATAYYDFDQVEGLYVSGGLSKTFELAESTTADVGGSLAIADDDQGRVYFNADETGLADVLLSAGVSHAIDEHTSLFARVSFSTLVDGDYRDGVDALGIEADNAWLSVGIGWAF
jgi:hypothetical protein